MKTYTVKYGHSASDCTPGAIEFSAENEDAVIQKVNDFVADGYRNETWATVDFLGTRYYTARNVHGESVGKLYE